MTTIEQGRAGVLAWAAQNQQKITLFYSKDNITMMRVLTPSSLTEEHVYGFDHWRRAPRTFRLDRVQGVML